MSSVNNKICYPKSPMIQFSTSTFSTSSINSPTTNQSVARITEQQQGLTETQLKQKQLQITPPLSCSTQSAQSQPVTTQSSATTKELQLPEPKRILFGRENIQVGWTTKKWHVGTGMTNAGNTCYLNSILQALYHVPSFANWLMADSNHRDNCDEKSKYNFYLNNIWMVKKDDGCGSMYKLK